MKAFYFVPVDILFKTLCYTLKSYDANFVMNSKRRHKRSVERREDKVSYNNPRLN
jgi:hypothetical protein